MRRLRTALVVTAVVLTAAAAIGVLALSRGEEDSNPQARAQVRTPERLRARGNETAVRVPRALVRLADRLPLERRVAQLFLVGFDGVDVSAPIYPQLQRRGWGGITLGPDNYQAPEQLAAMAGEAGVVAANARQVAPLVAVQESGLDQRAHGDGGAKAMRAAAKAAATGLREKGVSLVLAPVADIGFSTGPADGLAFSDDPGSVADLTGAAVDGWRAGGVVTAVAHFPGQGAASQDPIDGPASVGLTKADLQTNDLRPFRRVARRTPAVVVSSAAYAAYDSVTPASLTPEVVRGLLRGDLGFAGAALSDDLNGVAAATGTTVADAAVAALRAGVDMVYVPDPAEVLPAYEAVLAAVRGGQLSPARVRQALLRVLVMKRAAKLL